MVAGSDNKPQLSFRLQTGLTLTGKIGTTHRIEFTDALGDRPVWTALATVSLTNSSLVIPNTQPAAESARFYRAVAIPP